MTGQSTLTMNWVSELRQDCLKASSYQPEARNHLAQSRIAVTGGTGFLGTWIAEMVAALNDEYQLNISLDLYARNTIDWTKKWPHLSMRTDIKVFSQDIRSPFQFEANTNFVIHAAGVPNNRVHASDPLRVAQTTIEGINNALDASSKLNKLSRFINVSSCLVNGVPNSPEGLKEENSFPTPAGQLHSIYADAKRSAESIAAIYRSQFRMPICTIRPFTFTGPYQTLNRPWTINTFLVDALKKRDIRIHGDGSTRRSYLYGSDAAWWTLAALINGSDGKVYNLGSSIAISHMELANLISAKNSPRPNIVINTMPSNHRQHHDLYPNINFTQDELRVIQTCNLEQAIDKTWRWFSLPKP